MKKLYSTQKGFGIIEGLLVLIIIGVIGFVGWYVWHGRNTINTTTGQTKLITKTATATTLPKTISPNTTLPTNLTTIKVTELGIQIVNIPKSISDLIYAADNNAYAVIVHFSTTALSNLDKSCSPTGNVSDDGILSRIKGTFDPNAAPQDNEHFVKQFNGFWINYSHPEAQCSDNTTAEKLHVSQTATFQTVVTNPANIQQIQ